MTIQTYITHVAQHCGLDEKAIQVEIDETKEDAVAISLTVPEEEVGLFIGHHGDTLAALQRLIRISFHDQYEEKQLILNINDYREERQKQLVDKTLEIAQMVLKNERPYHFNYLSPYERFIVHSTLSEHEEFSDLESISEGEGRDRQLVIRLKSN